MTGFGHFTAHHWGDLGSQQFDGLDHFIKRHPPDVDITVGNNQLVGTPVGFNAAAGYDFATGWGTPNVANLVSDLPTA